MQAQEYLQDPLIKKPVLTYSVMLRTITAEIIPIILLTAVTTINNAGSATLISNLHPRKDYSAAAAIIFPSQSAATVIPSAFFYRINSILSVFDGEISPQIVATCCAALAILLSIPATTFSYFVGKIFSAIGTRKAVCDIVEEYNFYFCFALFPYLIASALYQIALNLKETRDLAYPISIINLIFTFGFSCLFTQITSLPGVSSVEVVAISFIVGSLMRNLCYYYAFSRHNLFEPWEEISWQTHRKCFWDILINGWKASIQLISELGAINTLPFLAEYFLDNKTENLSILNAMMQYSLFSFSFSLVCGQTTQRILRQKCKEEKYDEIQPYGNMLLAFGVGFNLIGFLLALIIPNTLVGFFLDPSENNNTGLSGDFRAMLAIQFIAGAFNACRDIIPFALRPFGIINIPTRMSIIAQIIGLSSAILLAKYTSLGIAGLLLGFYMGTTAGALYLLPVWFDFSQPERAKELKTNQQEREIADRVFSWDFYCPKKQEKSTQAYQAIPTINPMKCSNLT